MAAAAGVAAAGVAAEGVEAAGMASAGLEAADAADAAAALALVMGAGTRSEVTAMAARASEVSQPRQRLLVLSKSDPEMAAAHLQPYVTEAATLCDGGCNLMWQRM